jgi:hypothetical protein
MLYACAQLWQTHPSIQCSHRKKESVFHISLIFLLWPRVWKFLKLVCKCLCNRIFHVFLFFIYVKIQNFDDSIFLPIIKDSLKTLEKNILVDLHWKFAQEIIKTHENCDYNRHFTDILQTFFSTFSYKFQKLWHLMLKNKKWESCEKKENGNTLF